DFTLPCIRHDFGYRNFRDLLGEDAFRSGTNGTGRTTVSRRTNSRSDRAVAADSAGRVSFSMRAA
ncbi:hypothetical protein ACWC5I_47165, partial [Kitasatospora sp. NPDC001574]